MRTIKSGESPYYLNIRYLFMRLNHGSWLAPDLHPTSLEDVGIVARPDPIWEYVPLFGPSGF